MKEILQRFFSALQFLTRVPVPRRGELRADDLARSSPFFPVVGLLIAAGGLLLHAALARHFSRTVVVLVILVYLVLITGGLHEDGLGDAADGFGGGWDKEQILRLMRDSRIGSYGAVAISFSLLARFVCLSEIPPDKFAGYFVAGQVLSRWTSLPLAFYLPGAVDSGQGTQIARRISSAALVLGTVLAVGITVGFLKHRVMWVGLTVLLIAGISGLYYRSRIGGITGDCLGATIQLAEIGVYLVGVAN